MKTLKEISEKHSKIIVKKTKKVKGGTGAGLIITGQTTTQVN